MNIDVGGRVTFVPSELTVKPSRELSRAVAAELAKEDNEETNEKLNKLFDNPGKQGGDNDLENKLTQTQAG